MHLNEVCHHHHDQPYTLLDKGGCQQPWLNLSYREFVRRRLDEINYKEIATLIDPNFLKQGVRAAELKIIQLNNITPFDHDTMLIDVVGSKYGKENYNIYYNSYKFMQWDETVADTSMTPIEAARLLIWAGDLKLHCTCPSFLFWGYQYLLSVLDAAIYPEERPPVERNPRQTGIICKHLNRSLKVFPFMATDIAKEIKKQRANLAV